MSDFEDASLILTPNAYKAGKAYCVKPFDGSGDFTVVRNTTATYRDENGLIKTALANEPRLNYPIGGGCPSWLIEPQSTNLITRSENFSNAYWAKTNSTITANATTSPNGTLTADKLVENSSFALHRTFATPACSASTTYTASIFVKKAERTRIQILETTLGGCIFDLENGTIVSGGDAFIEDYSNDWYRCGIKRTTGVSQSIFVIQFRLIEGVSNNYQGDGTSGIYIWGAQLEQGDLTSYIPTNGTAVTRNADVLTVAPPSGTTEIVETLEDITYYIGGNNLVEWSQEFDNAEWFKLAVGSAIAPIVTPNAGVSPDGNTTADRIVFNLNGATTLSDSSYLSQTLSNVANTVVSVYLKSATGSPYVMSIRIGSTALAVTVTNDWQRFELPLAASNNLIQIGIRGDNYGGLTNSDVADVLVWGAQLEEGSTATTYQATRDIVVVPATYQLPNGEIKNVIMT